MDPAFVTARLRIVQEDGHVFAELEYTNIGDRPAYLSIVNGALGNTLDNNVFKIKDERGTEIRYAGRLVKRPKPGPADFQRLEPGARTSTRVQLDGKYRFRDDGAHDYAVVYSAYHQYPDRPGFWELVSNEVHFVH